MLWKLLLIAQHNITVVISFARRISTCKTGGCRSRIRYIWYLLVAARRTRRGWVGLEVFKFRIPVVRVYRDKLSTLKRILISERTLNIIIIQDGPGRGGAYYFLAKSIGFASRFCFFFFF